MLQKAKEAVSADERECGGCGSSLADRVRYANGQADVPLGLSECPHCGAAKCAMCDLGDDVECGNCNRDDS